MQTLDLGGKFLCRIFTAHPFQHAVISRLQRDVKMAAHFGGAVQHVDHFVINLACLYRTDADSLQPFHLVQIPQQTG
ncbi:hypothetical protein D3C85_1660830 [compost metagenome]